MMQSMRAEFMAAMEANKSNMIQLSEQINVVARQIQPQTDIQSTQNVWAIHPWQMKQPQNQMHNQMHQQAGVQMPVNQTRY